MIFADPREGKQGRIIIKDDVMIGSGVHMYVANHRYDLKDKNIIQQGHQLAKDICIEEGAWIGANAIILPGVTVGKNSVIGAGSVVTHDIPPFSIAVGSPARVIKKTSDA